MDVVTWLEKREDALLDDLARVEAATFDEVSEHWLQLRSDDLVLAEAQELALEGGRGGLVTDGMVG